MDPLAAFKSEVFRPIASIVLPGVVACAPFVIVVCNSSPGTASFYKSQAGAFLLVALAIATVIGMLLENLGSSIERGIDQCMEKEYLQGTEEVWDKYLSADATDSNAKRFLSSLVTRIKFINSMIPAATLFGFGMLSLHVQLGRWNVWCVWAGCAALLAGLMWLFRTSTELSEAASNTRNRILVKQRIHVAKYRPGSMTVGRHRHFAYVLYELFTSRVDDYSLVDRPWFAVVPDILRRLWVYVLVIVGMAFAFWFVFRSAQ